MNDCKAEGRRICEALTGEPAYEADVEYVAAALERAAAQERAKLLRFAQLVESYSNDPRLVETAADIRAKGGDNG